MALLKLSNHPLLQTTNIVKVIREFDVTMDDFILSNEIPVREVPETRIVVDVRKVAGGMTQAAKSGAESPTVSFYGMSQFEFEPAEWREKVVLTPKEIFQLRKLGTKQDIESSQAIIARHLGDLNMRLENRLEWCRWQALFGSLTHTAKDIQYSIDYKIPSEMTPSLTGADKWDTSTSDPMDDILAWVQIYRDLMAKETEFLFNKKTQRIVMQSSKIRALRDALFTGQPNLGNLTPGNLKTIFQAYAGIEYNVYDGGYMELTDLTSAVASSGTTLNVRDVGTVSVGDSVVITHRDGDVVARERLAVVSVNVLNKTIVVDSPGVVLSAGYPAGSTVRVKKFFVPDGKFVIRGQLPNTIEGGSQWAEIISTVHPYGADPLVPSMGKFAKVIVHDDDDPPSVEIIVGINGLPVVYHRDVNIIATVY